MTIEELIFTAKPMKDYVITTSANENGKYVVPEVDEVPKRHWGKVCTNRTITWEVEADDNN